MIFFSYLLTVQTKASLLFPLTVYLCTNKSFCIHLHGRTQNNIWALTKQLTKQKTNCHLYRYFQTHVTWLLPFSGLLTKRKMWMSSLQSLMPIEVLALEIQEKPLHSIERTEICQTQSKLLTDPFKVDCYLQVLIQIQLAVVISNTCLFIIIF